MHKICKSVYISDKYDATYNLGLEDYLMSICKENEVIMYLWQNDKTVVIGKHQNPLKECNIEKMREDEVNLVRRQSGGGAVYQDLGNLNFTFIAWKDNYNVEKQFQVVLDALKEFGINACQSGRNDITVNNKKISGNAFSYNNNVNCHHGTLLINVNVLQLENYLTPLKIKMNSKGIDSVRKRVANLVDFNSSINKETLIEALINTFDKIYEGKLIYKSLPDDKQIYDFEKIYQQWDWNFAESPKSEISYEERFNWGNFQIDFAITNGIISHCIISTDTLIDEPFLELQESLINKKAKLNYATSDINKLINDKKIRLDLINLMKKIMS